jgi:hypothetical protein
MGGAYADRKAVQYHMALKPGETFSNYRALCDVTTLHKEALRGETKGWKIGGKMGTPCDISRDGPTGHQPTASRCDLALQRRLGEP